MSSFSRYMSHTTFQTLWNIRIFLEENAKINLPTLTRFNSKVCKSSPWSKKALETGIFIVISALCSALCTVSYSKSIRLKFRGICFKRLEKIQRCSFTWKLAHQHKRLSSKIVRFLFLECKANLIQHKRLNIYSIFFEITEASPCTDI